MLSPKFVEPVDDKLITFLFVTFMFSAFALIVPETFRVPVKLSVSVSSLYLRFLLPLKF